MRQLSHLDRVLNDIARWFERKPSPSLVDWHRVEINFRTKPPVQFDLAPAIIATFLQCAEIQKAEIQRLLHFKDKWRRNEDP
ncbi:MAG: hypothetical protein DME65_02535 [Verrucomicrobia bacterium]|nr:MAG: hypothetical protein DME65_02535 [Verrucomicrobiota bacterium]